MPSNQQGGPSETERLRQRLLRVETRLERLRGQAPSDRTTSAAFTAGAVALFLSMALPWVRSGGGVDFTGTGEVIADHPSGLGTGWNLLVAGIAEAQGLFVLSLGCLLALCGFAVSCHFTQSRFNLVATMVLCALVPVLFFVAWIASGTFEGVGPGSGVMVMLVSCGLLGWAAYRAWHQDLVPAYR